MLLTNGEIFQGAQALAKLSAMEFPVKTSYGILRVMRQIKDQADVINETRDGLIKRYDTPKDGGQTGIQPGDDNWESFVSEFNTLMNFEVDLDVYPIVLTEDGFGEDAKIDAATLASLERFLTDKPYDPNEKKEETTDVQP